MSSSTNGSALCLTCGLCCTGVIFRDARLENDEVESARRLRLPIVGDHANPRFSQPCPQYQNSACSIYEERPRACREFVCNTLAATMAGELDPITARARIERLRALAKRITTHLSPDPTAKGVSLWDLVDHFSEQAERAADQAHFRAAHDELLLDLFELESLCRRDFDRAG